MRKRIVFASCILVILVVAVVASTGGRLKTPVARETWEYKVVRMQFGGDTAGKESVLNKLGAEGWELVSSTFYDEVSGSPYDFYLKRRK
jgi:hypothetical protein